MNPLIRVFIYLIAITLFLGVASCEKDPCESCDSLPGNGVILVGDWEWQYSVRTSDLSIGSSQFTVRDTITPLSIGSSVLMTIRLSGVLETRVDDKLYSSCLDIGTTSQFTNDFVCRDHINNNLKCIGVDVAGSFNVEGVSCDSLNWLNGPMLPIIMNSSTVVFPQLLAGYESRGSVHYFRRTS